MWDEEKAESLLCLLGGGGDTLKPKDNEPLQIDLFISTLFIFYFSEL